MFRKSTQKSVAKRRIEILGTAALWILLCLPARGSQSVTVAWDASTSSGVAGYFLHYGIASHTYTNSIDAGTNTQFAVSGLQEGLTYYIAITAYNSARMESAPSVEIVYLVPGILAIDSPSNPGVPFNLQFPGVPVHWYEIEASVDLNSWTTIGQTDTASINTWLSFRDFQSNAFSKRFYRFADHLSSDLPSPDIQSITQTGTNINFTWSALAGQNYQVQYADSPTSLTWNNLGSIIVATNSTETASYLSNLGSPWYFWSFRIVLAVPAPMVAFRSVTRANSVITIAWNAVAKKKYQIQYTTSLDQPNWNNLGGVITALGSMATAHDPIGPDPQRFYRVLSLP